MSRPATVMLVAGEASGDALGADLAKALRMRLGDEVRFVGVGGARLAEQGVRSPFDIAQLSVFGLIDGVRAWPRVKRRVADTVTLARRERPNVAVLIDSWGYTLRVAQALRRAMPDLPLIKYVGPQVWAMRAGRAKSLAATVDQLLTITPFDAPVYEGTGLPVTFVGNPVLSRAQATGEGGRLRAALGVGDRPLLLVLPGSRPGEIKRVMPAFGEAVRRLTAERSDLVVAVSVAETVAEAVGSQAASWSARPVLVEAADKADAMAAATVALACSGTVTSELALAGAPMVVGYRFGPVTTALMKRMVRTPYVVLANLALGREAVPEMIYERCNGPALAAEVARLLDDPAARATQVAATSEALDCMGRGRADPAEAAADAVLAALSRAGRS